MMFVRKQHTQELKEPMVCDWNHFSLTIAVPAKSASKHGRGLELIQSYFAAQKKSFEHEGQNAPKITSALADTCIQLLGPVTSALVKTLWLLMILVTIFLTVCHHSFSPSVVPMSLTKPTGVHRLTRWTQNAERQREDYYSDALVFSRHNIDFVFDDENMEPEQLTRAFENADIDPSTMRVSKWHQEPVPKDDDSQSPSTTRVSDVVTRTKRSSYQIRDP